LAINGSRSFSNQPGRHFWLGILDPNLDGTLLNPIRTAYVIEMGLLNYISHVIAFVTQKSYPTRWILHEYGRLKQSTPYALNLACWLHPTQYSNVAEDLYLEIQTEEQITGCFAEPAPENRPTSCTGHVPPNLSF
jgi:hypothetical protein